MTRNILTSLLRPEAYPTPVTRIRMIQTHVSCLFLTDTHVYKIKKPVDFGFLNFSTIDRRRFYCNEEVRLNRRLCPDIYEGVVEVRESAGGAAFFGDGAILDYAVRMKRLPEDRMLDRLVDRGEVTTDIISSVARKVAEFHAAAPTSPAVSAYGLPGRIMFNWQENFEQTVPYEGETLPADLREQFKVWVETFVSSQGDLLMSRVDQGFVRECDGDIHLENICLDGDAIHIFDCIEFSDRFRCCDVAADIAFLLMDLEYHGRWDLSRAALDSYLAASGDNGVALLIDFYKVYRAFVRGKVEGFLLNDPALDQTAKNAARERAARYFRLAAGYVQSMQMSQTLFITCGLMGSGKSTFAAQLVFELGITVHRSDSVRKELAGISAGTPVRVPFDEGLYSGDSHLATYGELLSRTERELRMGTSVVVDACFTLHSQRLPFAQLARSLGIRFVIIYLPCPETVLESRLTVRTAEEEPVSDGRKELLPLQARRFEPPSADEGLLVTLGPGRPDLQAGQLYRRLTSC